MALKLTVLNIKCPDCVETIKEAVKIHAPNAHVDVDMESKIVTIEPIHTDQPIASEESIKQAITAAGYQIAGEVGATNQS